MKRLLINAFALLLAIHISLTATSQKVISTIHSIDTTKVESWITKNVLPIKSTTVNTQNDDLYNIAPILKDKKIIALGDATHGTKEFFLLKQRMIDYMIKNMNCKMIAMELPVDVGVHINTYVRTGEGNIDNLLKKVWWWHKSEEIKNFIVGLKEYNKNLPDDKKVSFYGFDMQVRTDNGYKLMEYIKKVNNQYDQEIKPLIDYLSQMDEYAHFTPYRMKKFYSTLKKLQETFLSNKNEYIKNSSKEEYILAKMRMNTLIGYYEVEATNTLYSSFEPRDRANAENIKILSELLGDEEKMVLWAHNGHITTGKRIMQEFFNFNSKDGFYETNTVPKESVTGYLLRRDLGNQYFNIGFEFYEGSFIAIEYRNEPKKFTVPAPDINTLPYVLNKAKNNADCFFIELNKNKMDNSTLQYFNSEQYCHEIGAAYVGRYAQLIPAQSYNAIIFFRKTSASKLLELK